MADALNGLAGEGIPSPAPHPSLAPGPGPGWRAAGPNRAWFEADAEVPEREGASRCARRRRGLLPPRPGRAGAPLPLPTSIGLVAIAFGVGARIIQTNAAAVAAGFERTAAATSSATHSPPVWTAASIPTWLKQLARQKSHVVLDEYLKLGDPFESHPLGGVL